jgi:hypothetical protein
VRFVEADVLPGERVANAGDPHLTGPVTNRLRAAAEFKFFGSNFFELEYRRWDIVADRYLRKQNAASDVTHFSTQLGIGAHF